MSGGDPVLRLRGRRSERETLSRLVATVRAGESQVLVLRGEAGVGKTALLEYLANRASGCRIARAAGVESEVELAYAGLHQLCGPMLERLDGLPGPQPERRSERIALRPRKSVEPLQHRPAQLVQTGVGQLDLRLDARRSRYAAP